MKKCSFLFIANMLCLALYGQTDTVYIHTFGGIQNDVCKQVQPTADGGYIMIGTTNSFGEGNTSFYAIKTDSLCNFKWSKTYGGSENQEGFSVTPTLDKGFAFIGLTNSYGFGGYDALLVKTDSMGNVQWQKTYGGSNWDFGYSIQQLSDSGYIICGLTYSYGAGNGDIYVVRTNKKGDTVWTRAIGGSGYNVGNAVAVFEDSLYIIAGASTSYGIGDTSAILLEINDKGTVEWMKSYSDSTDKTFNSVRVTSDKGFIMYGSTDSLPGSTVKNSFQFEFLLKTDTLGNLLLIAPGLTPSPNDGYGADACQIADGSFLTLGSNSSSGGGGQDFRAFHLSSGGWFMQGTTFGSQGDEMAGSMAIGKNGDLIFAGSSDSYPLFSVGLFDVFMVRVKAKDIMPDSYDMIIYEFKDTTQFPASVLPLQQYNVGVSFFPNPVISSATLLVQGETGMHYSFNLQNLLGQFVIRAMPLQPINHGQFVGHFEKGNLPVGVYIYNIIDQAGITVANGKIIIN